MGRGRALSQLIGAFGGRFSTSRKTAAVEPE
jgi:hypothetical protein